MGSGQRVPLLVTGDQVKRLRALIDRRVLTSGGMESRHSATGQVQTISARNIRSGGSSGGAGGGGAVDDYKLLFARTATQETITNSTSSFQNFPTVYTLSANSVAVGDVYRINASGKFDWGSSADDIAQINVAFGGIPVVASIQNYISRMSPPTFTIGDWSATSHVIITAIGIAGRIKCCATSVMGIQIIPVYDPSFTGQGANFHASSFTANNSAGGAIDTTAPIPIQASCAISWADSTAYITLQNLIIERIRASS